MEHCLFSQNKDVYIKFFESFDRDIIKKSIIDYLSANPDDTLEHCREYSKKELNRYYGYKVINFYVVNPNNGKPSLFYESGGKKRYRAIV
jgi:hypothetical protein